MKTLTAALLGGWFYVCAWQLAPAPTRTTWTPVDLSGAGLTLTTGKDARTWQAGPDTICIAFDVTFPVTMTTEQGNAHVEIGGFPPIGPDSHIGLARGYKTGSVPYDLYLSDDQNIRAYRPDGTDFIYNGMLAGARMIASGCYPNY